MICTFRGFHRQHSMNSRLLLDWRLVSVSVCNSLYVHKIIFGLKISCYLTYLKPIHCTDKDDVKNMSKNPGDG